MITLIADSGSTKAEWSLDNGQEVKTILTQGLSPYFLTAAEISQIVTQDLLPAIGAETVDRIYFYGTGCAAPENALLVKQVLESVFPDALVEVNHDLMGAARGLCGHQPGIACILGTGSNSCAYNGKEIIQNSPGLGYVLGDEGSGAYLGKKVLQYYLYQTFDDELMFRFRSDYSTDKAQILENIYKKPLANRYLAGFALFLAANRGHYMIENIIEDGINDFFFTHLCKYRESWLGPIHFTGSVAFGFQDIIRELCLSYEFKAGNFFKTPMQGLVAFHRE